MSPPTCLLFHNDSPDRQVLHSQAPDASSSQGFGHHWTRLGPPRVEARQSGRKGEGVAQLAEPTAKRLQRPSWRDARLLVGVLLVLLGTVLGARLVAGADDRVPMYAAATAVRPGDRLTTDNLRRVDVQLGDQSGRYLMAASAVPEDAYAPRDVPEGELVPASAVGSRSAVTVQPVTVEVDAAAVRGQPPNAVVDVWVSPRDTQSTQERYLDATLALQRVSVSPVTQ